MKASFRTSLKLVLVFVCVLEVNGNNNRRQDVINEWIRTIKQSPKAHSMSPSWNGKSPYNVIGVGGLPLQSEVSEEDQARQKSFQTRPNRDGSAGLFQRPQQQRPFRLNKQVRRRRPLSQQDPDLPFKREFRERLREEVEEIEHRPRPRGQQQLRLNGRIRNNANEGKHERRPQKDFDQPPRGKLNSAQRSNRRRPQGTDSARKRPKKQGQFRQGVPDFGSNPFLGEEAEDFPRQYFEQAPRPGGGRPPQKRNRRPLGSVPLPKQHNSQSHRQDLDVNAGIPPQFKEPERPSSSPDHQFPTGDEIEHGFKPFLKPNGIFGDSSKDTLRDFEMDQDEPAFRVFDESDSPLNEGPLVELRPNEGKKIRRPLRKRPTPRPIPTPGPNDFPPGPPPRPTAPPTHPTHPTLPTPITHPPEHYKLSHNNDPFFNFDGEQEEDEYYDGPSDFREYFEEKEDSNLKNHRPYDVLPENEYRRPSERPEYRRPEYDRPRPSPEFSRPTSRPYQEEPLAKSDDFSEESEGFFEIPDSFPSFESLGSGFESMKIRNKRSADVQDPLQPQEVRYMPRRQRRIARKRSQRSQRNQNHRRQGDFSFQPGFWDDIESDFFEDDVPVFGQRQKSHSYRRQPERKPQQSHSSYRTRSFKYDNSQTPFESYRTREPYPEQSTAQRYHYDDYSRHSTDTVDPRDNEILGSGNFEVLKGGTFYDSDTYYHTRYNSRPQQSYGKDFLENFRDFADIKNDLYHYSNYK